MTYAAYAERQIMARRHLLLLALPTVVFCQSSSDVTVINSLGPVLPNETVVSIVPNFDPAHEAGSVSVVIDRGGHSGPSQETASSPPVLQQAAGVVHWLNDAAELDQIGYRLCQGPNGTQCGPLAKVNVAELWWAQCVGVAQGPSAPDNGLRCAAGTVLRLFGKSLAFEGGSCAPYVPHAHGAAVRPPAKPLHVRLNSTSGEQSQSVELASTSQSCWDATFVLPDAGMKPGNYTLEVKGNLPSSTWEQARDPDQRTLVVAPAVACSADSKVTTVTSVASLHAALADAKTRKGGATIIVAGALEFKQEGSGAFPSIVLPQCTVLKGSDHEQSKLRWVGVGGSLGVDCGRKNTPLIGPDPAGGGTATVANLAIEAVALQGCSGVLGTSSGSGFSLQNLNVSMYADMRKSSVFASAVSVRNAKHLLIENCVPTPLVHIAPLCLCLSFVSGLHINSADQVFLHCGNNTPGDAHAGVNSPILDLGSTSDSVIRNNMWQVGLSGWHIDESWHIVQESNVFTGYFENDKSRPLPNFDGSFWFSSYGQVRFPRQA